MELDLGNRHVARLAAIGLVGLVALLLGPGAPTTVAAVEPDDLRVYVMVLDGLQSGEVDDTLTPNLADLRRHGTWYEQARAVFPAETLPNHAAMMTGVTPQRNGIVANDYWVRNPNKTSRFRMQYPSLLGADTLTTTLENRCQISTATVQSKGYLWGLFRGEPPNPADGVPVNHADPDRPDPQHPGLQRQADLHWKPIGQPGYIGDPDDHAIDQSTMNLGFLPWVRSNPATPQFAFVNLGDIDRAGHVDQGGAFTSGGLTAFRRAAITDTDALVGRFVQELKDTGSWRKTVLIFASDHNMDWGLQTQDVAEPMTNAILAKDYTIDDAGDPGPSRAGSNGDWKDVAGGGTTAIYVEEPEDIAEIAKIAAKVPGVAIVATREPITVLPADDLSANDQKKLLTQAQMGMDHPNNGDIVVMAEPGWAFRGGNPIPGNHGHPATQRSVLMVSGGHPIVRDDGTRIEGEKVYGPPNVPFSGPRGGPGNLSIAPTVSAIFGLEGPLHSYDRGPLTRSFQPWALDPHRNCEAATGPTQGQGAAGPGGGGDGDPGGPGGMRPSGRPPNCLRREATIVDDPDRTGPIVGTMGRDVIVAGNGRDRVLGKAGRDLICGRGGKDRLRGRNGNDLISGGPAADYLDGGRGRDVLRGGGAQDSCRGGPGSDRGTSCASGRF